MNLAAFAKAKQPKIVLDVGCHGWRLAPLCDSIGATLIGADTSEPPGRPANAGFAHMSGTQIAPLEQSLCADLTVANHVLEHMLEPVALASTLCRHTRPGGYVWIEAPSQLSAGPWAGDTPATHEFTNFWDDPTHVRPWTAGSLYRLALSVRLFPVVIACRQQEGMHTVQMLAVKPLDGAAFDKQTRYVTLRDVPHGAHAAFRHVWGVDANIPLPEYRMALPKVGGKTRSA